MVCLEVVIGHVEDAHAIAVFLETHMDNFYQTDYNTVLLHMLTLRLYTACG